MRSLIVAGLLLPTAACSTSSNGPGANTDPASTGTSGLTTDTSQGTASSSTTTAQTASSGVSTSTGGTSSQTQTSTSSAGSSTTTSGNTSSSGASSESSSQPATSDSTSTSQTEPSSSDAASSTDTSGSSGSDSSGTNTLPLSNCMGAKLPSASPTSAGPFQVAADKNVGPLAGVVPDPIYGENQQRFNVYRPANLADSGSCHPILIWANGYRDNPEQNAPDCIVDSNANRWCGQYLPMVNHLASHGFVVVASLSTATAEGDPLPTIAGLDWILEQSQDPASPYYQRLDTTNIGQLGHSYGGMSTCMSASEPRYKALATICGTRALEGVHTPMLFFCGGNDETVPCSGVKDTFLSVTEQPAFFINERNADHGSWVYEGASGVSLSAAAAWFRAHLMDDAESRKFFYGANCTFCSDNRVEVEQNSLMQ